MGAGGDERAEHNALDTQQRPYAEQRADAERNRSARLSERP